MACNVLPGQRRTAVTLNSDAAFITIFSAFNLLGGFLSNTAFMLAPQKVERKLQEAAGSILVLALVFGLGLGSLCGPALVSLI